MSYVKVTVESALRSCSMLVPTRDRNDAPLTEGGVIGHLQVAVTDLFYLALGYPEKDYLEQVDPWHPTSSEEPSRPVDDATCGCGHLRQYHSDGQGSCSFCGCLRFDDLPF